LKPGCDPYRALVVLEMGMKEEKVAEQDNWGEMRFTTMQGTCEF
jgi:hypothetical protein